uniref:Uncharacterized protein n=1 Tax=Micrurus spixii TaxID=129469 RepID=A0A2D4MHS1_9SAUR
MAQGGVAEFELELKPRSPRARLPNKLKWEPSGRTLVCVRAHIHTHTPLPTFFESPREGGGNVPSVGEPCTFNYLWFDAAERPTPSDHNCTRYCAAVAYCSQILW